MNLHDILFHLLNFVAPALGLAIALPLLGRPFFRSQAAWLPWWGQMFVNLLVGVTVLWAGLGWMGRDGKMAVYAALVVTVTSSQWLLVRGWRR